MAIDNTEIVRRFVEQVWNKGNMTGCDELLSPKFKLHDPMLGDIEGIESAKKQVQFFRTAFPDFNATIDDIGAIGDKIYVRWTATGTHRGTLMGITPTNRRVMVLGMTMNRMEAGKIVETYYAWDVYHFVEQLGLTPPMQTLVAKQAPVARV